MRQGEQHGPAEERAGCGGTARSEVPALRAPALPAIAHRAHEDALSSRDSAERPRNSDTHWATAGLPAIARPVHQGPLPSRDSAERYRSADIRMATAGSLAPPLVVTPEVYHSFPNRMLGFNFCCNSRCGNDEILKFHPERDLWGCCA